MKIETIMNSVTGQEMEFATARGWTGNPEYSKFYPGDENKRSRYVTYLLATDDETGERVVLRVNFWNGIGEVAHRALEGKSALIELTGCRVSRYVDTYGTPRFSVNVNSEREYRVLDFTPFVPAGSGFKDILNSARGNSASAAEATSEVPF